MSKITPGAWGISTVKPANNNLVVSSHDGGRIICIVYGSDEERLANIKAITAVPEMLEALQAAEALLFKMFASSNEYAMVTNAIAKAGGKS